MLKPVRALTHKKGSQIQTKKKEWQAIYLSLFLFCLYLGCKNVLIFVFEHFLNKNRSNMLQISCDLVIIYIKVEKEVTDYVYNCY